MELTFQDFIQICTHFEEQNHFEFDRDQVKISSSYPKCFYYDATYRDEHNYKTSVRIYFQDNEIEWETPWEDAHDQISELFDMLFPNQSERHSFINYLPQDGFIRDLERAYTATFA